MGAQDISAFRWVNFFNQHGANEESCLRESAQRSCRGRNAGGEENWRVCASRLVQAEDAYEACHKSRKAGSVWQGGDGQSEASQEDCEGVPSCCFEIKYLSRLLLLYLEPLSVGYSAEWSVDVGLS